MRLDLSGAMERLTHVVRLARRSGQPQARRAEAPDLYPAPQPIAAEAEINPRIARIIAEIPRRRVRRSD